MIRRRSFSRARVPIALALLVLAVFAASPGSAQPAMVAGWDFSQYAGDGFMSIDGGNTFTNILSANYSDLDPTFGAGAESAAFGTMWANGNFGSTSVPAGSGNEQFLPSSALGGSLVSNLTAPGGVDFDSFTVLAEEDQVSTESLVMLAPMAATIVFEADLRSLPSTGSNWVVTFAGRMSSGASDVGVEFSGDGVNFQSFGTASLTTVDSQFMFLLGTDSSDRGFVRLTFSPQGADQPALDNLAISAVLAGVPTPTPTPSPTPGPTATPTATVPPSGSPTPTPTPTPTATPSTSVTPTATPTVTPTPTPTTLPPGDLSGEYEFLDRVAYNVDGNNQSFLEIDTGSDRFCLAGLVRGTDTDPLHSRFVSFEYRSPGTIKSASPKQVSGTFEGVVELTLTIQEQGSTVFSATTTSQCKLKAKLRKEGEKSKVRLKCDELGENLASFGLPPGFEQNVEDALEQVKHAKVDVEKGRFRVTVNGLPPPPSIPVSLSCEPPAPG